MTDNSRKKTLPLAVLAAPALAFGSLTFVAAPAMAVPVEDVQAILDEEGIDTALLVAPSDIDPQSDEEGAETLSEGSLVEVNTGNLDGNAFVAENGETYPLEPFEHAGADQYEAQSLTVPAFIAQDEDDSEDAGQIPPEISLDTTDAQVGETVRITIDNYSDVLASLESDDYVIEVDGEVATGESFATFGNAGIEQTADETAYEFTIPPSINTTDSGVIPVEADSTFTFTVTFIVNPGVAGEEAYSYSNPVTVNIAGDVIQSLEVQSEYDEILPGDTVTVTGSDFTPGSSVTITFDGEQVTTTTALDDGAIEASVEIPDDTAPGSYPIRATGSVEGEEATSTVDVGEWTQVLYADVSPSMTEAEVGDTVRLTIDNVDELVEEYVTGDVDYEIGLQGELWSDVGSYVSFDSNGIDRVEGAANEHTFDFTIPGSVETDSESVAVESGSEFVFYASITFGPEADQYDLEYIPSTASVEVVAADPALTVDPAEITLEDFVGDPDEGAGVTHTVTNLAPGTAVDFEVDTPEGVAPFSASDAANEAGEVQLHVYGEIDTSAYVGDYTTAATFEDEEGETQELSVDFSVVEDPEDTVTPVVDTEEAATEDETQTPTVGGQLADTGANGAPLMWIAGGLLALGGAFVIYANRARLFGRKN